MLGSGTCSLPDGSPAAMQPLLSGVLSFELMAGHPPFEPEAQPLQSCAQSKQLCTEVCAPYANLPEGLPGSPASASGCRASMLHDTRSTRASPK